VVFHAALSGMPELLEQVEKRGVSLKNEANLAGPLLLQAIRNRALLDVRFLLDIGVVQTAEMVAAALGQPEMLDLLEEFSQRHADARALGNNFWRQLSGLSREQVVEHLNSSRDQNFRGDMTPLQRAIQTGRQDVIRLLVERGVDPNQTGIREPLPPILLLVQSEIIAKDKDRADLIRMLAGRGAKLDVCTEESAGSQTALLICLERHLLESARQLLLSGADASPSDGQGRSAIDYLQDGMPASPEVKAIWELLAAADQKQSVPGKGKPSSRGLEL
jgi:ankyrin repeat protein